MSEETFASLHAKNLIHMAATHARLAENPLSTSEEDVRRWEALIAAAPETAAERDRLQAENTALVAALRELDTAAALALGLLVDAHDRGYGISEVEPVYDALAAAKERARAAFAAHAARAEGEGPR